MSKLKSASIIGVAFVLLYCLTTSISTILVNYTEERIDPLLLSFYAFLISFVLYNLLNVNNAKAIKAMLRNHLKIVIGLNIATACMWITVFYSLKFLEPAIFVSIFFGALPVSTTIITWRQPKTNKVRFAEVIFSSLIVLIMLALAFDDISHGTSVKTTLLCIGLAAFSGINAAIINVLAHHLASLKFTATQVLSQRFYIILIVTSSILLVMADTWILQPTLYIEVLLVAVTSVALPLFFIQKGLERIDPVFVSFIMPFIPVFTFLIQMISEKYPFYWVEFMLSILLSCVLFSAAYFKAKFPKN